MSQNDTDVCTCGHVRDEHGHDPEYPSSTSYTVQIDDSDDDNLCDCLAFELEKD